MKNLESKPIKWKIEFDDYLKHYINNNSILVQQKDINIAYVRFLCPVNYSDLSVLKFVTEIESSSLVTISIAEFDIIKRQKDLLKNWCIQGSPSLVRFFKALKDRGLNVNVTGYDFNNFYYPNDYNTPTNWVCGIQNGKRFITFEEFEQKILPCHEVLWSVLSKPISQNIPEKWCLKGGEPRVIEFFNRRGLKHYFGNPNLYYSPINNSPYTWTYISSPLDNIDVITFDYFIDKVFPTLTFDSEKEKTIIKEQYESYIAFKNPVVDYIDHSGSVVWKENNPKVENISFVDHINFINDINNVSQKRNIDNIESVPFGSEKDKQLFVKLNMLKTTFKY